SISKRAFVKAMQRLVPDIEEKHLKPCGAWAGTQAVEPSGRLAEDFCISGTRNAIHVINAPSPGATASMAIGHYIVDMAQKSFGLEA
ncbi:MAG: L-2-hydroxyglutarate oxidase, partial [Dehalococcoidia bacterium]